MKRHLTFAVLIATVLMLSSAVGALAGAGGTDRPLQAGGSGYAYWPGPGAPGTLDCPTDYPYAGDTTFSYFEGTMAHLGRVSIDSRHCAVYEGATDTGIVDIVAANGDVLHGTYEIWIAGLDGDQLTVEWSVTFDGTASSGRFAGATGSASGYVILTVLGFDVNVWPVPSWHLEGTITY